MAKETPWKNRTQSFILLSLFYFLFLGSEYLFDDMIAYYTDSHGVVTAQSYILGISALGFLFYPIYSRILSKRRAVTRYHGVLICFLICTACLTGICRPTGYAPTLIFGCILFFLLGILGNAVHYLCSLLLFQDQQLAGIVGCSYAGGILLQFISNNLLSNVLLNMGVLLLTLPVLLILSISTVMRHVSGMLTDASPRILTAHPVRTGLLLAVIVALMTCIFSTLDSEMTLLHVSGELNLGGLPRLLLACSGICAGLFFSRTRMPYQNLAMYCVTLLSTICIILLQTGGNVLISCVIFYLSAGIFAVYFTVRFMSLSYHTKLPCLWAGLGRAINNLCTVCISQLTMLLVSSRNPMLLYVVTLVIFIIIGIMLFLYTQQADMHIPVATACPPGIPADSVTPVLPDCNNSLTLPEPECNNFSCDNYSTPTHFEQFCDCFSLTDREREVLQVLLTSDQGMQELASRLYISRTMLYRHIASLNEKTSTKSRISLIQFYYNWTPGDETNTH